MTTTALRAVCFAGLLLLVSSCSEYLPISQGPLEGAVVELPDSWQQVAATEVIQLETISSGTISSGTSSSKTGSPNKNSDESRYSVNLWIALVEDDLHVFAGDNHTEWVQNIESNPNVRLGVNGEIFELRASRVTDPEMFAKFARVWETKYGNPPRNNNVAETYLMRLQPRP